MRRALIAAVCVGATALAIPSVASAQAAGCPLFGSLAPGNKGGTFTMLLRINQQDNVKTYTNFNSATGGLGGRVRPQDVFVINTRFEQTTPAVAESIATELRAAFPCNRIIALNGINANPGYPGYAYSLTYSPAGIWGVLLDWEPMDWNSARFFNGGLGPWSWRFKPNPPRFRSFASAVGGVLSGGPNAGARTGIAPLTRSGWDYGKLGHTTDRVNRRLGRKNGLQSVQTQASCQASVRAFGRETVRIREQYRFHTVMRKRRVKRHGRFVFKKVQTKLRIKKRRRPNERNLAVQVSFSGTPVARDPLPILAVSPPRADSCVAAGYNRGQRAFFFFASDASMRLLFQQPTMAQLRPATS